MRLLGTEEKIYVTTGAGGVAPFGLAATAEAA